MPRKDFEAVKVTEQVGAMYSWAVCRANYTAVINVFIFNKLDFQNCLLTILSLKLCMNIKSLSESQF